MSEEPIDLDEYKWHKEQERLEKIMLERYGSIEAELDAFIVANNEGKGHG